MKYETSEMDNHRNIIRNHDKKAKRKSMKTLAH